MVGPPWGGRRRFTLVGSGVAALVIAAVVAAAVTQTRGAEGEPAPPDPATVAQRYLAAWTAGDRRAMYRLTTRRMRATVPLREFRRRYAHAADVAGAGTPTVLGGVAVRGRRAVARVAMPTRDWGRVEGRVSFRLVSEDGRLRVAWRPHLVFPGLRPGERLVRDVRLPERRGRILSRSDDVLADGPPSARQYPAGASFAVVTGALAAPETAADRRRRVAAGWPAAMPYGRAGLERSLDRVLAGTPEIRLLAAGPAGRRRLAARGGERPHDVTTTLSRSMQETAALALGGRYGGVVVLNARTGAVLASAGIGMDGTQPPGSVFKLVTAAAALTGGTATPESTYAYARYVDIDGWRLRNFRGESCGGTLVDALATSCNSVFAPLAAEVGARPLVRLASDLGFNRRPPTAYPVPESRTPAPASMNTGLSVGVAGIGQGGVVATPLQMASVAQAIAAAGVQATPFVVQRPDVGEPHARRRVLRRGVARDLGGMMRAVVSYGTGVGAALAGVNVAGKTGTAEVGPDVKDDAWFVGFAPAERPRLVVSVLVVHGGVGGEVAAPIAGQVLAAGLG